MDMRYKIVDETQEFDQWSPTLRGLMKQISLRMDNPDRFLRSVGVSPKSDMTDFLAKFEIEEIRSFYDIWPDTTNVWQWVEEISSRI